MVVMEVVAVSGIDRSILPQGQEAPQRGSLIDLGLTASIRREKSRRFFLALHEQQRCFPSTAIPRSLIPIANGVRSAIKPFIRWRVFILNVRSGERSLWNQEARGS